MLGQEPYDPDVVAYLYGDSEEDSLILLEAMEARNNPSTLLKTSRTAVAVTETLDAMEEDIDASDDEDQQSEQAYNPCFKVTFSEPPTRKGGFVIGSDSKAADLAIKYEKTVSARQFALTFDKEHELMVQDLSSTNGTRVVYCPNNADEGRPVTEVSCDGIGMTWSTLGPSMVQDTPPVIIVANKLRFRLVVPKHDKTSKEYLDNVARFMRGQSEVVAVGGLSLKTKPVTALALPTHRVLMSRRQGRLPSANGFWQKRLSSGGTSVVDYVWNATTRDEFAIKRPKESMDENNNLEAWKAEAHVLNRLNHPNIVRLLKTEPEPYPQLHFEYSSHGTLEDYIPTSTTHLNKQVARQLLAALKYLDTEANGRHRLAHCDIKPANVLVHAWKPDGIQVKLCGFGLAKDVKQRQESELGTALYHTSTINDGDFGNSDNLKADIWSLGTLLVQLECRGLPPPDKDFSKRVIEFAHQNNTSTEPNSLLSFVLEFMLKTNPDERLSASECLAIAEERFNVDNPTLPRSDNDAAEEEGTPILTTPRATIEPDLTLFQDRAGNSFTSRLLQSTKTMMRGRVLRSESPDPSYQQFWDATGKICATMERTGVWPTGDLELITEEDISSESGSKETLELERADISTPLESELPSEDGTVLECETQEGVYLGLVGMADLESATTQKPSSERHARSKRRREESAEAESSRPVAKRPRTDESVERELYRQLEEADAQAEEEDAHAEEEDSRAKAEEAYFADKETGYGEACVEGEEASATNFSQFVSLRSLSVG